MPTEKSGKPEPPWQAILEESRSLHRDTMQAIEVSHVRLMRRMDDLESALTARMDRLVASFERRST